tara:strand:+ start:68 stop:925 length:858 start_codon:yes stop_codon:yes gene_type:complete
MFNLQQRSEENTNTSTISVRSTTDYGQFKYVSGNRILNESNINAIANQIRQHGQQQPIIINERYEIIDGQHRLEACKKLKIGVEYIKRKGATIDDVISTNIVGKKWCLEDYVNRFATEGKQDYIDLLAFIELAKSKGFATSTAIVIARGADVNDIYYMWEDGKVRRGGGKNPKDIKRLYFVGNGIKLGFFKMPNKDDAIKRLAQILAFSEWSFYNKVSFVNAINQCMRIKEMDFNRLLQSARKYQRRFTNEATTENFIKMFEEIYNWRRQNKLPIVNNPQRYSRK